MQNAKQTHGQAGSMEYILRSQIARSGDGIVKMAPGTAKRILDELNFPGQRRIDSKRVYSHAYAIAKGDWVDAYPIHFVALPDGRIWLVDGQHRLTAIAAQDSPVGVSLRLIAMESEQDARSFYAGFDGKGSVRTNVQILDAVGIADVLGLTTRMTRSVYEAAPLLANELEPVSGSAAMRIRPELFVQANRLQIVSQWAEEARVFDLITREATKALYSSLRQTGPVAVGLYTLRHQPKLANDFWRGVARNDGLRRGDPRNTLIQDILQRSMSLGAVRQRVQQSIMAWNAFCEGRDLKIIKCVTGAPLTVWGTPLNGRGGK